MSIHLLSRMPVHSEGYPNTDAKLRLQTWVLEFRLRDKGPTELLHWLAGEWNVPLYSHEPRMLESFMR